MEKFVFVASFGAMVPSLVLLHINGKNLVRNLPQQCNYLLDSTFAPSPEVIHNHLACMDSLGREMYNEFHLLDLWLFPLIYSTMLSGLLRRVWPSTPLLSVLPCIGALADVGENACLSYLLSQFPKRDTQVELAVGWLTPAKWLIFVGSVALVAVGGAWRLLLWATRATQPPKRDKTL